eukprot:1154611-Pelagomonas_calceolata.AAC.3
MELVSIAEEVCKQSNKPFVLGPMLSKVQQHAIHGSYADSSSLGDGSNGSSNGGDLEHLLEELAQCAAVLLQAGGLCSVDYYYHLPRVSARWLIWPLPSEPHGFT